MASRRPGRGTLAAAAAVVALASAAGASAAAAAHPWVSVSTEKHSGTVTAVLSGQSRLSSYGVSQYRRLRLVVTNQGKKVFDEQICTSERCGLASHHTLSLQALWQGSTPDAVVDFYTGGAHCCFESMIVLVKGTAGTVAVDHDWGDPGYRVVRYDGNAELVTADDRFAYAFTSFAGSGLPIQVWTIDPDGQLENVTWLRQDLVAKDAARWWQAYVSQRGKKGADVRGVVAAWCADEYQLSNSRTCESELTSAVRHGFLNGPSEWPQAAKFVTVLESKLSKWGYPRA